MLPHYVEAYKATDEGRGWAEEEEQADTRVFGARLVCQSLYPSHQAFKRAVMDTVNAPINSSTCTFSTPFVTALWNLQMVVVKRFCAWKPPAALQRDAADRRAYCKKGSSNKEDQKPCELTDIHGAFTLLTSALFSEGSAEASKGLGLPHFPPASGLQLVHGWVRV